MEGGLLSDARVARASEDLVCIKLSCCSSVGTLYGLDHRLEQSSGAVLLLSPEGEILKKYIGDIEVESFLSDLERLGASPAFLDFYFTVGDPPIEAERLDALLDRLDSEEFGTREKATQEAMRGGYPIYKALAKVTSRAPSLEIRARLARIQASLKPMADRIKRRRLDRDVGFLARLMTHEDTGIRKKALVRVRRILPQFEGSEPEALRALWSDRKDTLRWDSDRGRYVDR